MANSPQLDSTSEVLSQYDLWKLVVTLKGGAISTKLANAGCDRIELRAAAVAPAGTSPRFVLF